MLMTDAVEMEKDGEGWTLVQQRTRQWSDSKVLEREKIVHASMVENKTTSPKI